MSTTFVLTAPNWSGGMVGTTALSFQFFAGLSPDLKPVSGVLSQPEFEWSEANMGDADNNYQAAFTVVVTDGLGGFAEATASVIVTEADPAALEATAQSTAADYSSVHDSDATASEVAALGRENAAVPLRLRRLLNSAQSNLLHSAPSRFTRRRLLAIEEEDFELTDLLVATLAATVREVAPSLSLSSMVDITQNVATVSSTSLSTVLGAVDQVLDTFGSSLELGELESAFELMGQLAGVFTARAPPVVTVEADLELSASWTAHFAARAEATDLVSRLLDRANNMLVVDSQSYPFARNADLSVVVKRDLLADERLSHLLGPFGGGFVILNISSPIGLDLSPSLTVRSYAYAHDVLPMPSTYLNSESESLQGASLSPGVFCLLTDLSGDPEPLASTSELEIELVITLPLSSPDVAACQAFDDGTCDMECHVFNPEIQAWTMDSDQVTTLRVNPSDVECRVKAPGILIGVFASLSTFSPSPAPSPAPSSAPSPAPTSAPSSAPTTTGPSASPTTAPTAGPFASPTPSPTPLPTTTSPTTAPSAGPPGTPLPTPTPTSSPTMTSSPTGSPSSSPTPLSLDEDLTAFMRLQLERSHMPLPDSFETAFAWDVSSALGLVGEDRARVVVVEVWTDSELELDGVVVEFQILGRVKAGQPSSSELYELLQERETLTILKKGTWTRNAGDGALMQECAFCESAESPTDTVNFDPAAGLSAGVIVGIVLGSLVGLVLVVLGVLKFRKIRSKPMRSVSHTESKFFGVNPLRPAGTSEQVNQSVSIHSPELKSAWEPT